MKQDQETWRFRNGFVLREADENDAGPFYIIRRRQDFYHYYGQWLAKRPRFRLLMDEAGKPVFFLRYQDAHDESTIRTVMADGEEILFVACDALPF